MIQRQVLHSAAHHDRGARRSGGVFACAPFTRGFDRGGLRRNRGSLFGFISLLSSSRWGHDEGVALSWFGGKGEQLDALRGARWGGGASCDREV